MIAIKIKTKIPNRKAKHIAMTGENREAMRDVSLFLF